MNICAKSDIGKMRKINQDNFGYYVTDEGVCFFIVADGMGGHNAGEVASLTAVDTFITGAKQAGKLQNKEEISEFIQVELKKANDLILYKAAASEEFSGMGTTAVTAVIDENGIIIGNIGDSRAYMISGGNISQITTDHSYVEQLLKAGKIDEEEARNHPRGNEITKAVGVNFYTAPDIFEYKYKSGDVLLLCSDGLNKMISDSDIFNIITSCEEPEKMCDCLIQAANDAGGRDNITVIVVLF